jgi:hypothetical protein
VCITRLKSIGAMMNASQVLSLLLASLAWQTALADQVYKSVDSAGRVTYSSTPPAGTKSEKVELPPTPSEADTQQAAEQVKKAEARASELEAQRLEREAAEKAKEEEEARLREAEKPVTPVVIEKPVYVPTPIYGGPYPPKVPRPVPVPR